MKKILVLLISIMLLVGCTSNSIKESNVPNEYYLTYNDSEIKPNTVFNNLFAIVGPYNNMRVEESSYSEGNAVIYEYDDFEIETYMKDNVETIYSIVITNEKIVTNEGIHLFSTKQEMLDNYGNNYESPSENVYIYKKKNSNISFILENDIIIYIKYYKDI